MSERSVPLLGWIAAAGLLAAAPAVAGPPSPLELHRELRSHVHDVLRELGRVPERIHARHRAHLEAFFGGRSDYAPHRHDHVTYRFPVRVGGHVDYRPYHYCDDALFGSLGVRLELGYGGYPGGYRGGYPADSIWCDHCRGRFHRGHRHPAYDDGYRYRPLPPRAPRYGYDQGYRSPSYRHRAHLRGDHRGCDHDRGRYDRRERYDRRPWRDDDRDDDHRRHDRDD